MLLAGGKGERLGEACRNTPKPMIEVAGKPFIEHLVRYLEKQDVRNFIFLTGYLGNVIEDYFSANNPNGSSFKFIRENKPLGTGTPAAQAIQQAGIQENFILLNGDSLVEFSVEELTNAASGCDGALVAIPAPEEQRYGFLSSECGILTGFSEKDAPASGQPALINGGVYCLTPALFAGVDTNAPCSIERDLFPAWLQKGNEFALIETTGSFLDIGTPESLAQADDFILKLDL